MSRKHTARKKSPPIESGYELPPWFSVILARGCTNNIANPSLETNDTGYTAVGGTFARTAEWQSHGAISGKVTPGAGVNDGFFYGPFTTAVGQRWFGID